MGMMPSESVKGSSLDFSIPINPFWVQPMMKKARRGDTSPAEATKYCTERSLENREAFDRELKVFVRRCLERSGGSASGNALAFLWFLLTKFNRSQTIKLGILAIAFIIFRVGYQICYTQLMAVLAADPAAVVFPGTPLPPLALTIATFSIACLCSAWLACRVDQVGQNLGNQCRLQLIWSIQAATLRSTQTSISGFDSSEVVSLAGIDGMAISWCFSSIAYMFAVPIELAVLIWLSTTQVGVEAALTSLGPLVVLLAIKIVLVKLSSPRQRVARDLQSKRFGILDESIASNSVIKLMGMSSIVLGTLQALRKKEQNKSMMLAISNAVSLTSQVIAAPVMAWTSMVMRTSYSGEIASGPIMTVLGYYRTISTFDMYKIVCAIQVTSLAMVAADKYMDFFAAEFFQDQGAEEGGHNEPLITGKRTTTSSSDFAPLAELSNAAFTWQVGAKPTLHNISFTLSRGKLIAVCGPIACGKSSLLLSLLGELQCTTGAATLASEWAQPVAYSSQRAWLQTGTVRDNICFAEPVSTVGSDWLQSVTTCCGLQNDIESFPDGLDHNIGEAGASLSGGQKARLSLARAVYLRAPITLLDDPLCALDPALAEQVFQLLMGQGGLLRGEDRSVVLVTTNPNILAQCDEIVALNDGVVAGCGTFAELVAAGVLEKNEGDDELSSKNVVLDTIAETEAEYQDINHLVKFGRSDALQLNQGKLKTMKRREAMKDTQLALQVESMVCDSSRVFRLDSENYEEDMSRSKTPENQDGKRADKKPTEDLIAGVDIKPRSSIGALLFALGWWRACLGGLCIVVAQAAVYAWQFLLKAWLDGTETASEFQSNAIVFRMMIFPIVIPALLGSVIHYTGMVTGNTRLQYKCSSAVIAAPYSFFSLNPASRISGHLSLDSQQVESPLSYAMAGMWLLGAQLIGTIVITCISLWYLIFLFIPLAIIYYFIQRHYSKAVVPMANLDAVARGPVNTAISTTLAGLPTVRAFKRERKLERQLSGALRNAGAMSSVVIGCGGWLGFLANFVIFGIIAIGVSVLMALVMEPGPESLGPIVLSNIMSLSGIIGSTAVLLSNVETSFTALQRLVQYAELPNEETVVRGGMPSDTEDGKLESSKGDEPDADLEKQKQNASKTAITAFVEPPSSWPAQGCIEYRNAYAAYVWGTLPALKNVTITVPAGSSCALVGRSGSGKSTAFLALTGMIPIVSGTIKIDGVACDRVAIDTLRAALAVVPQDPVLFSGGLRSNLDPGKKHSDAELWNAVRVVGLEKAVQEVGGLETDPVAAGMSQGQRQLLCLARALLRDVVLLLLDEANASLDLQSELILAEIVKKFASGEVGVVGSPRKRTVVEVAHRLRTVVDMDQVVVLSAGEVIENGTPSELIKKEGGVFVDMLKAQGLV